MVSLEEIEEPSVVSTQLAPTVEEFQEARTDALSDESEMAVEPRVEGYRLGTQDGDVTAERQGYLGTTSSTRGDGLQAEENEETRPYEERIREAEALKAEGNQLYSSGEFEKAEDKYTQAIEEAPGDEPKRAVYLANRAACRLQNERFELVIEDCTACLEINPIYTKALLRRAQAYEKIDNLENAHEDLKKVVELEPNNTVASKEYARLAPLVEERREKLKDEMIDKLKDLGNSVLGNFGLSLDNFKATKDPNTGSYSINFQQ
uniref:Tetratricopeptide repeat protein 1 n=1 Tax=Pyramimonas obovata TaxID=1411642 RepID=A0A7S0WL98_9CHLO|mmetsp:Transcript_29552/g.64516  ORF Transcript_29552/g.64516 Transcript_29552/m.64516 type:complete len:263 (+) Transcript_29552:74-862(+)